MKIQLLKKANFLLLTLVSFVLISLNSCKKDEDNTPPEISIISPSVNDTVRNSVEIKYEVKDNEGVSYVEIYTNDSLIGKITESSDSYTWNTLTMKDGNYNIKCKVYDKSGNYKEESRDVTIENALLKLDIGDLYGSVYNILITDSSGNVLAKSTFKTGDKFSIYPTENFNKKTINVLYFLPLENSTITQAYLNLKRGFVLSVGNKYTSPATSAVNVHIKKTNIEFTEVLLSTDGGVRTLYSLNDTVTPTQLYYTPTYKLLVQIKKEGGWFYKFFDLSNKTDIWIDLNDVNLVQSEKIIQLPVDFNGSSLQTGCVKETDVANQYYLSNNINFWDNKITVNYPSTGFEQINSFINCSKNNVYYDNMIKGQIPDNFVPINVTNQVINSKVSDFKMTLDGEGDFYILSYQFSNSSFLNIYSTCNIKEFKLPDLSAIYQNINFNFSNLQLKQLRITKINDMPKGRYLNSYIYTDSYLIPWKNSQSKTLFFEN